MLDLTALLRPELAEAKAYLPTQGSFRVRLDANEAPPLFPDSVRARLAQEFASVALERYPDATAAALRQAVAARLGVEPQEVLLGVGSDEVIGLLLGALGQPRGSEAPVVLTTSPTFVMYRMSARLRGQRVLEVPLDAEWDLAVDALLKAAELAPPAVVFIASPNNPTGTVAGSGRLERLIEALPRSIVVVDEAYVDYADRDRLDLFRRYENVVVLRTLSKIGFASLRVGWLVGRAPLIQELDKLRFPYNLNGISQALARVVLTELWDEVRAVTRAVVAERARLARELAALPGLAVTPPQANFLWVKSERPAAELFQALGERGILVRSFHSSGGRLAHQLRITVGTPAENDELVSAWREIG
ncbi:MAG TPA: histidinol-phosphate transaminase [Polyangiaceae bacterium]